MKKMGGIPRNGMPAFGGMPTTSGCSISRNTPREAKLYENVFPVHPPSMPSCALVAVDSLWLL
jgi:hypothetical protein